LESIEKSLTLVVEDAAAILITKLRKDAASVVILMQN